MKIFLWIIGVLGLITLVFVIWMKKGINDQFLKGQEYAKQNPSPREYPDSMKIDEDTFWTLIESTKNNPYNINEHLKSLTTKLSNEDNDFIKKFECTLREILMKSYHFNVMAAQKLIDNYVSDDTFLYFRCAAILQGKTPYYTLIDSTDNYGKYIVDDYWGEGLLFVADDAYNQRNKTIDDNNLPRSYASAVNYDFGTHVILGEYWKSKREIKKRFPRLYYDIENRK